MSLDCVLYNTETETHIQNVDIDISRRVINPEYNKETSSLFKRSKRALSQAQKIYHRTNGRTIQPYRFMHGGCA